MVGENLVEFLLRDSLLRFRLCRLFRRKTYIFRTGQLCSYPCHYFIHFLVNSGIDLGINQGVEPVHVIVTATHERIIVWSR